MDNTRQMTATSIAVLIGLFVTVLAVAAPSPKDLSVKEWKVPGLDIEMVRIQPGTFTMGRCGLRD